ncbi:Uncharacterised protein [Bordetella pertussis]|nr:Uncharacterised protein [Bordetella pertussis]
MRATPLRSSVESMRTWLTPAFSVYTRAWRAFCSSQLPLALLPVKSTMRTAGSSARRCAVSSPAGCAASSTTSGSKPASPSTSRATWTVRASGRMAPGCGLTMTVLPVARLANRPG